MLDNSNSSNNNMTTVESTIPRTGADTDVGLPGDVKEDVEKGIELLLAHFTAAGQQLFPRKMATYLQYGIMVRNKQDILNACKRSSYIDCRLSAYPFAVDADIDAGLVAPTILFCDIDRKLFSTEEEFQAAFAATCAKISETFGENMQPTILWTGNGYHVYIVVNIKQMNRYERLVKFCPHNIEVSKEFLRYAEWYLTSEKCDPEHAGTLSFKSCLLRIPGTFNLKCIENEDGESKDPQVKIIQESIGIGEISKDLLRHYRHRLIEMRLELREKEANMRRYAAKSNIIKDRYDRQKYFWIEKLILTPIDHNRYFVIFRLLAPYCRRILKLSHEESEGKIREWLLACNNLKFVNNLDNKITKALLNAHNFRPMNLDTLREENAKKNNLYQNILNVVT
jgi:hypothetical protein